jgi:hypothetical protein
MVFWIISYVITWLILIAACIVILMLSREVDSLHYRVETLEKYISQLSEVVELRNKEPGSNYQHSSIPNITEKAEIN